jgi:rRNA-processing protein FCF1
MGKKLMILLDTNFILDLLKFKIHLEDELNKLLEFNYEVAIIDNVEEELKKLSDGGNRFAKLALKLLELGKIKKIKVNNKSDTDNIMLNMCKENEDIIIATNDVNLRKKIKEVSRKTIYIRSKKHLAID